MNVNIDIIILILIDAALIKIDRRDDSIHCAILNRFAEVSVTLAFAILLASCAAYGPYHGNTSSKPLNSVRGAADGRYKLAFIEFGDQGSALDTSQRTAALSVIQQAQRPLLFVYIHGWQTTRIRVMSAASSTSSIQCRGIQKLLGERSM